MHIRKILHQMLEGWEAAYISVLASAVDMFVNNSVWNINFCSADYWKFVVCMSMFNKLIFCLIYAACCPDTQRIEIFSLACSKDAAWDCPAVDVDMSAYFILNVKVWLYFIASQFDMRDIDNDWSCKCSIGWVFKWISRWWISDHYHLSCCWTDDTEFSSAVDVSIDYCTVVYCNIRLSSNCTWENVSACFSSDGSFSLSAAINTSAYRRTFNRYCCCRFTFVAVATFIQGWFTFIIIKSISAEVPLHDPGSFVTCWFVWYFAIHEVSDDSEFSSAVDAASDVCINYTHGCGIVNFCILDGVYSFSLS